MHKKKFKLLRKMRNDKIAMRYQSRKHTANVLPTEYTDVCLGARFKNEHWLFLHVFFYNGQQIFSCCFYFAISTKSTKI